MTDGAEDGRAKSRPRRGDRARGAGPGERRAAGGRRHLGRILALQVLYETDVTDHPPAEVMERTFQDQDLSGEEGVPEPEDFAGVRAHVERLVGGIPKGVVQLIRVLVEADTAGTHNVCDLIAADRLHDEGGDIVFEPNVLPRRFPPLICGESALGEPDIEGLVSVAVARYEGEIIEVGVPRAPIVNAVARGPDHVLGRRIHDRGGAHVGGIRTLEYEELAVSTVWGVSGVRDLGSLERNPAGECQGLGLHR